MKFVFLIVLGMVLLALIYYGFIVFCRAFLGLIILTYTRIFWGIRSDSITAAFRDYFRIIIFGIVIILFLIEQFIYSALGFFIFIALSPCVQNFIKNCVYKRNKDYKNFAYDESYQNFKNDSNFDSSITLKQAYDILNVSPQATLQEIKKAHHHLIQKIHPDHSGSDFLATQVNLAKELLIKNR